MQFQGLGQSPSRISSKLATNVPGTIQIDQCNRHKGCSSSSVSSRSTVSTNKGYFQLKHLNYFYFLFLQGKFPPSYHIICACAANSDSEVHWKCKNGLLQISHSHSTTLLLHLWVPCQHKLWQFLELVYSNIVQDEYPVIHQLLISEQNCLFQVAA